MTAANEIVIRRTFVGKPSNNNSLFATICANRITVRDTINNRRKSWSKIKIIHNLKILLSINYYVSPADSLNGWDAARLRPPWLHFVWDILVNRQIKKEPAGDGNPLGLNELKNSSSKRAGNYSSSLSLLLSTRFHCDSNQC